MNSARTRNTGLRRLSAITRWVAAGAVVVSGAFAAIVARAQPGHANAVTSTSPPAPAPTTVDNGSDPSTQAPLQPAAAPVPTRQAPVAVSGSS